MDFSAGLFALFLILLLSFPFQKRFKRDAVGTLDIITNNAQPIHADVKVENAITDNGISSDSSSVSTTSAAATEKVTAPKDVTTISDIYPVKSLRKSWPLTNRLDLIRSVSRLMTLSVMIIAGIVEFWPLLQHLLTLYGY